MSPVSTMKMCTKCFSAIGPGKEHICKKTNFNNNMKEFIQKKSPATKSKLACTILKTTASDSEMSTRGGVVELQSGSKKLPVTIGTPKDSNASHQFSHEDMKRVQTDHNLSDKTVKYVLYYLNLVLGRNHNFFRSIAKVMREKAGRSIIQPGFSENLTKEIKS